MRSAARRAWATVLTAIRARAVAAPGSWWLNGVPPTFRSRWLIPPPAPGLRRVEIGSGHRPRRRYVHVDVEAESPGGDLLAAEHRLSLPSRWADEALTVHTIEHLAPSQRRAALSEWHRVLRAEGVLRIQTPNADAPGGALLGAASPNGGWYWAVRSAIFDTDRTRGTAPSRKASGEGRPTRCCSPSPR